MKKINLIQKRVPARMCPYCSKFIDDQGIELKNIDLILSALEANPENRRGILNINKILKVIKKIDESRANKSETIEFEDAEFELIKRSIDQTEWLPIVLKFQEFFKEIEQAEKAE
jgi:hypothetical protein